MKSSMIGLLRAAARCVVCWTMIVPWFGHARAEEPISVPLWEGVAPDETAPIEAERTRFPPPTTADRVEVTEPTQLITNVSRPMLVVYPAAAERSTGAAIMICPGGGYWDLFWRLEGEEVAEWLNANGITAAILKYRVPRRPGESIERPAMRPLQDAQRGMRLLRSRAAQWNAKPDRLGVIGFSAGANLAIRVATRFAEPAYPAADDLDRVPCRPDFAIAAYPGYLIWKDREELHPDTVVPRDAPPMFLVHGSNDPITHPAESVLFYLALRRAGVSAELHVYADTVHDFGVRRPNRPYAAWTDACLKWIATR
jgi:acetyl esterase/lipase